MTTLCSFSQADDLFPLSSNNNYNNLLQDYETVSHLDLFHSSQLESFKDIERQRRATQSHIIKKNKLKLKTGGEKLEQRRKRHGNNSSSSGSSSASESDQEERNTRLSGSCSESDRKKNSNNNKKSIRHTDRSNKRADRHRRPEDEILSSSDDNNSGSESESEQDTRFTNTADDDEIYEERIRFKRNLNFKTEDTESTRKLNAYEWKQIYVQKLDEKDHHRAQQKELQRQKKHTSRS